MENTFRSGFVTLIGRPNAGKSTLINAIVGKKVCIVSNTPQTTRHRFRAVANTNDYQLILVDTPGIHKPHDMLGEELNRSAIKAIESVDVISFLLDASKPFGTGDEWVLNLIKDSRIPRILVISKSDLSNADAIEKQIQAARAFCSFDDVVSISALLEQNIQQYVDTVVSYLPQGPRWFPTDTTTDQPLEIIISEFIREKILSSTFDELPHAVGLQVEELNFDEAKDLYRISAEIFVERNSQKGIIIGAGGEKIKLIGTQARMDLEHFLGSRVFLDLRVKVKKDWRKDAAAVRRFGYGEGL